jgi:hypothetical protein
VLKAFFASLLLAVGVGGTAPAPVHPNGHARIPAAVLGVFWNEPQLASPRLAYLKPLRLDETGRDLRLRPGGGSASARSPSDRFMALGTDAPGVELVDLHRMKEVGFVRLGGSGWVTYLFWERGLVYAVVDGDRRAAVALIDPVGGRLLERYPLDGMVLDAEVGSHAGSGQIVLLTAPRRHIGPVTVVAVGGKGIASAQVAEIDGGSSIQNDDQGYRARQVTPALAVERRPEGNRAIVVPAGGRVAEVSLDDLAVSYHALSAPVSLLGRLRDWLEPTAQAKVIDGPQRKAVSLGNGLVAVTGVDYTAGQTSDEEPVLVRPAGLSLIETGSWSVRKVDSETSDFSRFRSSLLAYGDTSWGNASESGIGLTGYDLRGQKLFHALPDRKIGWLEPSGDLAYVVIGGGRNRVVVDALSGRILGRAHASGQVSVLPD